MADVIDFESLDLSRWIRPGDLVLVGQAAAEPLTLTQALVEQRASYAGARVFLGATFSSTFTPDHLDHLKFAAYGAMGRSVPLARAGGLEVLPSHYSELPETFATGRWFPDVVMLSLADDGQGGLNLGLSNDYVAAAAHRARVVIAEINPHVPVATDAGLPAGLRIDVRVRANRPPLELPSSEPGETEKRIGAWVAKLVPDGATIQTGIGVLPDAILSGLLGHRDLGLHTGLMTDRHGELMEAGVINNRLKTADAGVSVTNLAVGSRRLYDLINCNPRIAMRPIHQTHGARALAQHDNLFALNSVLEVDLTGQANSETLGATLHGGVGGINDFARAARASKGGRSVISLASSARGGTVSRIVPRLSGGVATVPRSDADVVITEWGIADLRQCSLAERATRLIEVAAPQFREALTRALKDPGSWAPELA